MTDKEKHAAYQRAWRAKNQEREVEAVKPTPPADLWAQMDALIVSITPPEGSFTVYDIAERYKIGREEARHMVEKMVRQDKVQHCGCFHGKAHYILK